MSHDRKGVIRWELDNLNIIVNGVHADSPSVRIAGLTWKMSVNTECSPRTNNVRQLGMFLLCSNNAKRNGFWRADHTSILKLIHRTDSSKTRYINVMNSFSVEQSHWGNVAVGEWRTVINQETGFIENGKLLFEAHIHVSDTPGVSTVERVSRDFATKDETTDICIIVEGKKVHVSKWALSMHSHAFKAMFHQEFVEKNKREIELQDVKHEDFISFLNIVCGSIRDISDEIVEGALEIADRFQAKFVLESLEDYLIYNSKLLVTKKLILSDVYRLDILQGACLWQIKTMADARAVQHDDYYKEFSTNLKLKMHERVMALPITINQ